MSDLRSSTILVADDDEELLDMVAYGLRHIGYDVMPVRDGPAALARSHDSRPDMVLLDVGLPRMNGIDVCRSIRERSDTPVILVTGRGDEDSVVRGYLAGADDYVVKPFSHRQLALRIQAVLRRARRGPPRPRWLDADNLHLDEDTREARLAAGRPVRLTSTEFRILQVLAANVGHPVPTDRIVEHAWGLDDGDGRLLKSHVYHIRRKLGLARSGPGSLEAIPRLGYVLRTNP